MAISIDCSAGGHSGRYRFLRRGYHWRSYRTHLANDQGGVFGDFIYDIAVRPDHRRKGVGRRLVTALCEQASKCGIREVFVPADSDDVHALDFYRALGGAPSPVTIFTFS